MKRAKTKTHQHPPAGGYGQWKAEAAAELRLKEGAVVLSGKVWRDLYIRDQYACSAISLGASDVTGSKCR